jgi:thioredoxin reductase (NADPH)
METPVKIIWNSVVDKIEGDDIVKKILIKDVNTNETREIEVDGVFIEVGEIPTTNIVQAAGIEVNERNFIKVNEKYETNIAGVYAAGDVVGTFAQIIRAAAGGAEAATNAYLYLKGGAYGTKMVLDYGEKKAK